MINNNNEYNIKLYNSVFNNIYLKRIILNHLTKYNILYNNIQFESLEELESFKYKQYLNNITIPNQFINQLPKNIKHTIINEEESENYEEIIAKLPNHIETFSISTKIVYPKFKELVTSPSTANIVLSKLNQLDINVEEELDLNLLPKPISNLNIEFHIGMFNKMVGNGSSLKLLTSLTLIKTPAPIINLFSTNSLVRLEVDSYSFDIGSDIQFPNTIQELIIGCGSFNAKLPDNLKSFTINMDKYKYEINYPPSLEYLSFDYDFNFINPGYVFKDYKQVPTNLKKLILNSLHIVDNNGVSILPNTLKHLKLKGFNQTLQANQLPSSLTHLDLGFSYNKLIGVNALPSNLEKLILRSRYTQIINPLAIPPNLKLLKIDNPNYSYPIDITPSSHPYTAIYNDNLNTYYKPSNTSTRVLRLPYDFNEPLLTLQLQDKSSLEYLHLGDCFDQPIQLSDLPINNNIKVLELSQEFNHTINLEFFKNLETIIINQNVYRPSNVNLITSQDLDQQKKEQKEFDNDGVGYNNYKLKNIIVTHSKEKRFLKKLNINFYKYLQHKQQIEIYEL